MPPEKKIPTSAEIDQALKEFETLKGNTVPVPPQPATPATETVKASGNSAIEEALKEFEVKSVAQQPAATSPAGSSIDSDLPRMVKIVMKLSGGRIKEQRQAEYVLIGLVVLMFLASLYFFFGGGTSEPAPAPVFDTFVN